MWDNMAGYTHTHTHTHSSNDFKTTQRSLSPRRSPIAQCYRGRIFEPHRRSHLLICNFKPFTCQWLTHSIQKTRHYLSPSNEDEIFTNTLSDVGKQSRSSPLWSVISNAVSERQIVLLSLADIISFFNQTSFHSSVISFICRLFYYPTNICLSEPSLVLEKRTIFLKYYNGPFY